MEHPYLKHYSVGAGDFILDLGATQGDFLSEMLPEIKKQNAHVLCVEPEPYNVSRLSEFISKQALGYASLFSGIASKDVMCELCVTDQMLLHHDVSVDRQKWKYKEQGTYKCPGASLYTLCCFAPKEHVSFVKCDIEGGEIPLFRGAHKSVYEHIDSLAIAAYHVVDGKRTHETLVPFFKWLGYNVEADLHPEKDNMDMVYAWR